MSPVEWWILIELTLDTKKYKLEVGDMRATGLLKPTDPQISSNPESTRNNDEGQGVSANMPDTISIYSSEMPSERTSNEIGKVVAQPENNIGKYNCFRQNRHVMG